MTDYRRIMIALALAGLLSLGLGGCGKKGPLYLPEEATRDAAFATVSL